MFDHVTIRVRDLAASEPVYARLLGILGYDDWGPFALVQSDEPTTGLHIGFAAPSREHIEHFWQAGLDAGWEDDGAPGLRPEYGSDYYGGFLRDADGNSVEAARHDGTPGREVIDHLWIRVADLDAARATFAPLQVTRELPGRLHFGQIAVVIGEPTVNVTLTVDGGHTIAL